MSFTFKQSGINDNQASSATTIAITLTGVVAGNLIVVAVRHEDASTTITCSDGTTSLTAGPKDDHSNGAMSGAFFYLLAANSGNVTYTCTFAAAKSYRSMIVEEHTLSSACTYDVGSASGAEGSTTTPTSNSITTSGTDELVLGLYTSYAYDDQTSAAIINSLTADGYEASGAGSSTPLALSHRNFASTFTGTAGFTKSKTSAWLCLAMAFKIDAGGSTAFPMYAYAQQ